jgi:hypothetical protein
VGLSSFGAALTAGISVFVCSIAMLPSAMVIETPIDPDADDTIAAHCFSVVGGSDLILIDNTTQVDEGQQAKDRRFVVGFPGDFGKAVPARNRCENPGPGQAGTQD